MDAVNCYVELHGFGKVGIDPEPDSYAEVAVYGAVMLNNYNLVGIITYIVEPSSCSASDYQPFDTHNEVYASRRLVR